MKKLLTIAMVAFAAVAAKADLVLYWSVAENTFSGSYALLQGVDGYGQATGIVGMNLTSTGETAGMTTISNLVAPLSSYSDFIVALLDGEGNTLAVSTTHTAGDIASWMYNTGSSAQPPSSPYTFSGFTASIPEPTSAMLIMLGLGALALRRRA